MIAYSPQRLSIVCNNTMLSKSNRNTGGEEMQLQPCAFCEFVKNNGGLEVLDARDEKMYQRHLSVSHGLEK